MQQYFSVYGTSTLMCVCVYLRLLQYYPPHPLVSSFHSLLSTQSIFHVCTLLCPLFEAASPFSSRGLTPFALLTCLCFFFFYLMETLLWSDSICSNTQLSDAQPHGPGRFEVGLVLTAGFTHFHQVSVLSKLYKKRFGSKKKNHDSFTEIFIFNPMINTSHCSPYVHLTVDILWTV